jgi:hypothetical protein
MRYATLTALLLVILTCSQSVKAQTDEPLAALTSIQREGIARTISHFDRIDLALKFGKMEESRRLLYDKRQWLVDAFEALPQGELRAEAFGLAVAYKHTIDMLTLIDSKDPDLDQIEPLIKKYELQDLSPSEMPAAIYKVALARKKAVAQMLSDSPTK